jgi:hydrogenase/urease accessory protein HupE
MTPIVRRHGGPLAACLTALLLLPIAAHAHGIGSARDKSTLEFVPLGIEHMLLGYDHLLFILGCVLLAGTVHRAAKFITTFILGHSLTLIVATLAGWQVSDTAVDVVIALSVVFVGVVGFRGRPESWTWFTAAIFGFGLIHGLGLSTRLQFLGLPEEGQLAKIIAFNVGLEIGQLIAIGLIVGIGRLVLRRFAHGGQAFQRPAFAAIAVVGLVAAMALALIASKEAEDTQRAEANPAVAEAEAAGTCEEERGLTPPDGFAGGHPAKFFYGPDEQAPEEDLAHVIGDGYVIVRYREDAPEAEITALRAWVGEGRNIVAAPASGPVEAATATTAYRRLSCSEMDVEAIKAFGEQWLADVQNGTAQQ